MTPVSNQAGHRQVTAFAGVFRRRWFALLVAVMVMHAAVSQVCAEVRTVNGRGHHRMGDRDTKEHAIRLAVESAKRNALEQVATYVESVTIVNGMNVTKDEIRAYSAGLVIVLDQHMTTRRDGDAVVVEADLLAQVDTEEAAQAIATLRKNEEARGQLAALKRENERLHRELDRASRAMAGVSTSGQTAPPAQRQQEILYRVQSNAIVSQAWTNWALALAAANFDRGAGRSNVEALLQAARDLDPSSPHIAAAERVMAAKRPPVPPQLPSSFLPGQAQARMPRHEIVPRPGSSEPPRTLNEIIYSTPATTTPHGSKPPVWSEHSQHRQEGAKMPKTVVGDHNPEQP